MSESLERAWIEKVVRLAASSGYHSPDDAVALIYRRTKRLQLEIGCTFRGALIQASSEVLKLPSPDGIRRDLLPWGFAA